VLNVGSRKCVLLSKIAVPQRPELVGQSTAAVPMHRLSTACVGDTYRCAVRYSCWRKAPYPAGLDAPVSSSFARFSHEGTAPHSLFSSSGATSSGGSELAMAAYASEVMVSASLGETAG